jgi:AcrR family transcriptional regulator
MPESSTSVTTTRRQRERRARVARIRNAAIEVFTDRGYDKATMDAVARRAELGKSSLYYYFRTKQELFAHIVEHTMEELARGLSQIQLATDPLAMVEAVCRQGLAYFKEHRGELTLFLRLHTGNPERLQQLLGVELAARVAQAHAPMNHALGRVADGLPGGEVFLQLLGSLLLGMALKLQRETDVDLEGEIDLLLRLLRRAWSA